MFEKILLGHLTKSKWSSLNRYQAGFRKGYSTMSHIIAVDEISRRGKKLSTFLDLMAAYDRCDHRTLLKKLKARKCPTRDLNIIFSLMIKNCVSFISVNQSIASEPVRRTCGLFQGSILSPLLFNVYIDDLSQELNDLDEGSAWLFADDICLKASNEIQMRLLLKRCEEWAKKNNMKWNLSKCGVVSNAPLSEPLTLNDIDIPAVKSYKYLGVPFERGGVNWRLHAEKSMAKRTNLTNFLRIQSDLWTTKTRIAIFKAFVRPITEYCEPLLSRWLRRHPKELALIKLRKKQLDNDLSWILNTKQSSTVHESLLGIGDVHFRSETLMASFARHIQALNIDNPLKNIISKTNAFHALKSDCIVHLVKNHPLLAAYQEQRNVEEHLTWRTFLRREWIKENDRKDSVLVHYIGKECRRTNLQDSLLLRKSKREVQLMIKWRLNRACIGRGNCSVCQEDFKRTCFDRCFTSDPEVNLLRDSKPFIDAKATLHEILEEKGRESKFTVMDFMLNSGYYDLFCSTFKKATQELIRPP
jgi:hypothetical protein